MDVDECIAVYTSIFEDIFKKRKHRLPINFRGNIQGQFDSKVLRKSIVDVIESRQVAADETFTVKKDQTCRT